MEEIAPQYGPPTVKQKQIRQVWRQSTMTRIRMGQIDLDPRKIRDRWRLHPELFYKEALGYKPWQKQVEIAHTVREKLITVVASCNSAGKTSSTAACVLWFLFCYAPCIVVTTAPTARQVRHILWKEIGIRVQNAPHPLGGKLYTESYRLSKEWFAVGFTTNNYKPDAFSGWHEQNVLVVVDEACGISDSIEDAIQGLMASGNARLLMIGNPVNEQTPFGRAFKNEDAGRIRISAFDTPNFTKYGITQRDIASGAWRDKCPAEVRKLPRPYLVNPHWVAAMYKQWGAKSPYYIARVLARFPQGGYDTLFSIADLERAQQLEYTPPPRAKKIIACDPARYGDDETVIVLAVGSKVRVVKRMAKVSTMVTAGYIVQLYQQEKADVIHVGVVGIGSGIVDRLHELSLPVRGFNEGMAPRDPEHFVNAKAENFWGLRSRCEESALDLPTEGVDDHALDTYSELGSIRWTTTSAGKIAIVDKKTMRQEFHVKSPNIADAIMMAYAQSGFENEENPPLVLEIA